MPTKKLILGIGALGLLLFAISIDGLNALQPSVPQAHAAIQNPGAFFTELTQKLSVFMTAVMSISFIAYDILTVMIEPSFFLDIVYNASGNTTFFNISVATSTSVEDKLNNLWQFSRNIVNIILAFILIVGAATTVVTAKKDFVAKHAFRFVLAVILVNFSWFFPRVILDVANVLTATVYQLPQSIGTECKIITGTVPLTGFPITKDCIFVKKILYFKEAENVASSAVANPFSFLAPGSGVHCPIPNVICIEYEPLNSSTNTASGILSGLAMSHARLPTINQVSNPIGSTPPSNPVQMTRVFIEALIKLIWTLALGIVMALVQIMMFIAFLIRIPVLWITIAFMPFMFVGFIIGDKMGQFNTMRIFNHFVKAAFLPTVIAVPLAVGYILINELQFASNPRFNPPGGASSGFSLPGEIKSKWQIIWQIMTVIVIWQGVKAALKIDEIYSNATRGVQSFGDNLGKIAANAPLNIPIIPVGKDGKGNTKFATAGEGIGKVGTLASLSQQGRLKPSKVQEVLSGQSSFNFSNTVNIAKGFGGVGDVAAKKTELQNAFGNSGIKNRDEFVKKLKEEYEAANNGQKLDDQIAQEIRRQLN